MPAAVGADLPWEKKVASGQDVVVEQRPVDRLVICDDSDAQCWVLRLERARRFDRLTEEVSELGGVAVSKKEYATPRLLLLILHRP
eukprot:scaffold61326_cov28-Tisochrysis_lutea.AAC.6